VRLAVKARSAECAGLPHSILHMGQAKYALIPRKTLKNNEGALERMDCWWVWFLRDLKENNNHRARSAPWIVVACLKSRRNHTHSGPYAPMLPPCRIQLKRGLFWYRHHPNFHEMVSDRSSRAENWTDQIFRKCQCAYFLVQQKNKKLKLCSTYGNKIEQKSKIFYILKCFNISNIN